MDSLTFYVPKILHHGLRASRYFSWRTDSIAIQSDTHRSFQLNFEETHKRLAEEIREVYKTTVPGVTSSEQQKKVDQLYVLILS
jgi:peptidyl-tRNA hydrolase ICT1